MPIKKNILTYAGLKTFEAELEDLRVNKRREIAEKIKEARAQGDLSENAEYDAAKDEQRDIEARITELESLLKNAEVIDEDSIDVNTINIGSKVKIQNLSTMKDVEYVIVGGSEANSLNGRISADSPIGVALVGAKKDEIVTVEAPSGAFEFKILEIQRV